MTTMILSPSPVLQFFDDNGALLVGGKLFTYEAGTTTKQSAYTDSSGSTPLPNPVILNARGEVAPSTPNTSCGLWLDPTLAYKMVLAPANDTDPPTNAFWTIDNIVSPQSAILAALAAYEATIAGVQIGSILPYGGTSAPTGWQLCYGQAISRTTYSALFAVIGIAFGAGDGSTTFNVPDLRGRAPIGADNMGGAAANRVTAAGSTVDASAVGNSGGTQFAQTDTLTASAVLNLVVDDPGHTHVVVGAYNGAGSVEGPLNANGFWATGANTSNIAFTGLNVTASPVVTVTSGLTGTAQNMPPVQITNFIVYAGA